MATRNRTNLYISYRQSYAHHPTQSYSTYNPSSTEELDTLISNRADAAIEMDILPPAWADKTQEVDEILLDDSLPTAFSHSSGRPCKFGWTSTGAHIVVIWEEVYDDPRMLYPVTAYEVPPPRRRKR